MILNYYCRLADFRDGDFSAIAVQDGMDWLIKNGILETAPTDNRHNMKFQITNKGRFYVDHILKIPFPKQMFIIPEKKTELDSIKEYL